MAFTRVTTLPDADTVNDSDIKYDVDAANEDSDTTSYDLDTTNRFRQYQLIPILLVII